MLENQTPKSARLKIYDMPLSGNCYKVRQLLSFLDIAFDVVPIDLLNKQQKTPEFLALNTFGQVPVLNDGDLYLRDSQAILFYLAATYDDGTWLPRDAIGMAKVMQWLSTASNEIANSLAAARVFYLMKRPDINLQVATTRAHSLLNIINQHLATRAWLELDRPTLADIACFPYIAMAHEGKISLEHYPHTLAWIERFKQLPRFINLPSTTKDNNG